MNDESKFSVDEILEAERKAKANGEPEESEKTTPGVTEEPDAVTEPETEQPVEEASAEVAQPAPEAEPQPVEVQEDSPWDTYEEEDELGIVAPVPVSVAMNDPNAVVPENKKTKDKVQNFQTAMLQDAQT
ncbi:hypothetical protein, partial [Hominenteromicrobium sp.]|uniref:hypothetical protein n=1 Tax=Hominenteromicrobium sp. TaxID=3073581 RepID=UPI003AF0DA30